MTKAERGFTLVELMVALAIVLVLASVATGSYVYYVMRSQLAQVLVDYGHIREVVALETRVNDKRNLQLGSVAGQVPPALRGVLSEASFSNPDTHTRLQLIKAPQGTFASFPNAEVYALVASSAAEGGAAYLRVLRHLLPHADGDKLWLSSEELCFPLDTGAGGAGPVKPPDPPASEPGTGPGDWGHVETDRNGSTWTARATICLFDVNGNPLVGVNMEVEVRATVTAVNADGTPGASWERVDRLKLVNGCATYEVSGLAWGSAGQYRNPQIQFGVVNFWSYDGPPAVPWDGNKPTLTITQP